MSLVSEHVFGVLTEIQLIFWYLCGIYENNYLPQSRKKGWIFTSPL